MAICRRHARQWDRNVREPAFAVPRPVRIAGLLTFVLSIPVMVVWFGLGSWQTREARRVDQQRQEYARDVVIGLVNAVGGITAVDPPEPPRGLQVVEAPPPRQANGSKLGSKFLERYPEIARGTKVERRQGLAIWLTTQQAVDDAMEIGIPGDVISVVARSCHSDMEP